MAATFLERARREQFIGCAVEALDELGYAGTSVAEVARRAEVSKSVVLYHFSSKAELLEAVVTHIYGSAGPTMAALVEAAGTHRERLAAYVRGCVDFAWTHRAECRALREIFANLRRPDGRLRYTAEGDEELIGFVAGLLTAGQEAGEFGAFDARALAIVLRSTIDALPGRFEADPNLDGPTLAERLVEIFAAATEPKQPR